MVPIDKSSTVLTILLAFVLLGEPISIAKGVGIVAIAAGTYLMIQKKQVAEKEEKGGKAWLVYAVLSAVFAALVAILGKIGISGVESNLGTALRTGVVLVMAWVVVLVTGKQKEALRVPRRELV